MNRTIINTPVGFLLILMALILGSCEDSKDMEVGVEEVSSRDITEKVSANGKIQPEVDVKITSEISGKITAIHVKEGDMVETGELLISINSDLLEANQNRASATLDNSRANHANAKARAAQADARFAISEKNYGRTVELFQDGVVSQAEMDQVEAEFLSSKAEADAAKESVKAAYYSVRSAEATKKEADDNLDRTNIYAPTDGVITALQVEEGETVLGTIQMSGTELMRVSKLDLMEVDVEVNESDIVRVSLGDTAEVEVDAYMDEMFLGVVTEIANASTNAGLGGADQVTNFSVKIRILPSSYSELMESQGDGKNPFRTGLSATVEIITNRRLGVLSIPIESVTTRTDTSSAGSFRDRLERRKEERENKDDLEPMECVFLFKEGEARIQVVKTGVQDNRYIEITEGLVEGQEVITGPYSAVSRDLENGSDVKREEQED
jgi:HlyD family secretion protein